VTGPYRPSAVGYEEGVPYGLPARNLPSPRQSTRHAALGQSRRLRRTAGTVTFKCPATPGSKVTWAQLPPRPGLRRRLQREGSGSAGTWPLLGPTTRRARYAPSRRSWLAGATAVCCLAPWLMGSIDEFRRQDALAGSNRRRFSTSSSRPAASPTSLRRADDSDLSPPLYDLAGEAYRRSRRTRVDRVEADPERSPFCSSRFGSRRA